MLITANQQRQPLHHLFHHHHQPEGRVSVLVGKCLWVAGSDGQVWCIWLCWCEPPREWSGVSFRGFLPLPKLNIAPKSWQHYLAAMWSSWWSVTRGGHECLPLLAVQCHSTCVLLNFWRGREVLAAGLLPGVLASTCTVAALQGAVMHKQLDKLLSPSPLNADTVTHALKLSQLILENDWVKGWEDLLMLLNDLRHIFLRGWE